jgi:hypothetical protein
LLTGVDILLLHGLAHFANLGMLSIVEEAVAEDELDILQKLTHGLIKVFFEIIFDSSKIHWLLNDFEIVVYA